LVSKITNNKEIRQWLADTNDLLEADVERLGSKINEALANIIKNTTIAFGKQTIKPNLQSFKNIIKTHNGKKPANKSLSLL
jgi:hypothetical protein